MLKYLLYSIFFISLIGRAQTHTGFKQLMEFDSTRTFDTIAGSPMHFRPVKLDLFYPSSGPVTTLPLLYGHFLEMYSLRMDYNVTSDSAKKVSRDLSNMFAEYLKLDSGGQYLQFKTSIYQDIPLPTGKYPLIIYAAGMNGSSWENVVMFDSLCKAGYIVAAVSSVGLFPGYMSTGPDIIEQVKDVLFTEKKMLSMPFIDTARTGLLSWSMGGSAITKAAMVNKKFKCLLSYDGTEIHYYGVDSAWDKTFDVMNALPPADASAIELPYLYISSGRDDVAKMYNILHHIGSKEKSFEKMDNGMHEDFSSIVSLAVLMEPRGREKEAARVQRIWKLTREFFDEHLKNRFTNDN